MSRMEGTLPSGSIALMIAWRLREIELFFAHRLWQPLLCSGTSNTSGLSDAESAEEAGQNEDAYRSRVGELETNRMRKRQTIEGWHKNYRLTGRSLVFAVGSRFIVCWQRSRLELVLLGADDPDPLDCI